MLKFLILSLVSFFPLTLCGNSGLFMEENSLNLQDSMLFNTTTENDFNQVINKLQITYNVISQNTGKPITITGEWKNSTVNAYAYETDTMRYIVIYGGLARRPEVTLDGLALVVCHEAGHHFGGFPFYLGEWAANEGQSDYYATLACARTLWGPEIQENEDVVAETPTNVRKICNKVWYDLPGRNLCYRSLMAGKSLADLLAYLHGTTVDFSKKDGRIVKTTSNTHPKPQCRLDTYVAGALCVAEWDDKLIPQTEWESLWVTCPIDEFEYGSRPRCWFAAKI